MDVQRIVTILLRRWWLVLGMPALVLGISLVLLSTSPYVASVRVSVLIPGDTQETGNAERPELMVLDDVPTLVTSSPFADNVAAQLQQANPQYALSSLEIQSSLSADYYSRIVTIRATRDDEQQAVALIEAARAVFDQQVNFSLIAEGEPPATIRPIEPTSVTRDSPATGAVALAIQTLVALLIGCGLAALAAAFDPRIHTRSDALAAMPVPVLGDLRSPAPDWGRRRRGSEPARPADDESPVVTMDEPVRALRATLESTLRAGVGPVDHPAGHVGEVPVWMIVGVDTDERGAASVVSRLGTTGAAAGDRCLVVDASPVEAATPDEPFAAWLASDCESEPPVPGLAANGVATVVRIGVAPDGRDLMRGPRWNRALVVARSTYDVILIAVRPMTVSADAMTLARHVDAILLLVAVGRTNGSALVQARAALQAAGGTIAGTVLVDAKERIG